MVLAVGTRLQDFTTGSWALFKGKGKTIIGLNTQAFDAGKHRCPAAGLPTRGRALANCRQRSAAYAAPSAWTKKAATGLKRVANRHADAATAPTNAALPSDAQVIGAVQRHFGSSATLVCAAGGLPGELHKLWRQGAPGSYHMEYGFSCMGYEIAGGLGVKLAKPEDEVIVMVGDGSYMMMNSEIASSVMLGAKLTIVVLDNRGYRLHQPAADGDRRRELQQSAEGHMSRGVAGDRLPRPCRKPRRGCLESVVHRRT